MTPEQLAERGRQAQQAFGFLSPALDSIRAEYMEALTAVAAKEPWASDKIVKLAVARNVIDKVEAHLRAIIANGGVAEHQINRAREIAELPVAKRKWL
ncbi:hypothetical protein [Rhizorhapis sp.]|uniref:hypothetical protein n=1 Tax=Rhizorhapis sp. TaxID=1968842 RepID=UPI002B484BD9|nr:hypothetical protein [Rhizorhapis sp.]HKR17649.1 hypothetical protein [Rhizorhapis sp.]